ncbi:MAG: NAD(P)H-dependent oxidoreductase [Bacteroidales bacterium]|nr:NAD(P)H-dependent oxidoreductase [Bacteroidales bacterium]MDD2425241.1 NAD(P)H-dependent oxidoreductase [Bacteroidales bacterium]MDD3988930.1 NAD(P)H-dependent oxidoreductase [Bacteroidales bacterium]MDD4638782.1 NAD(P)H-dependent oxidoreductase [Bacteroidales bacterium]
MGVVDSLKWRYATKRFDSSKKISREDIEYLKEAVSLIPSSNGLQPYKVLIIEDKKLREKLREVSWGQPQITEASHLFVFCNFTEYGPEKVDSFIQLGADINNYPAESSRDYAESLKAQIGGSSASELSHWTAKQAYLALGSLITAASELNIDNCPMEGFLPQKYDEILGLKEKGMTAAVICALGYRSEEDKNRLLKKVRKPIEDLFDTI